jgi:hypothetical protein
MSPFFIAASEQAGFPGLVFGYICYSHAARYLLENA